MAANLSKEQKIVVFIPVLMSFLFSYLFKIIGNLANGLSLISAITNAFKLLPVGAIVLYFSIPFYILSFYLSAYVTSHTKRESYYILVGGLIGIFLVYALFELSLIFNRDPMAAIGMIFLPFFSFFSMLIGTFLAIWIRDRK